MADVAFLWHLHQPNYVHPETGRPAMPWTRLHALRGYRDLALFTVEQEVPWTLNVVPTLLDQLLWYREGGTDRHLELTRLDVPSPAEAAEICSLLPGGHPAMASQHPRYSRLRQRCESGEVLAGQDLFDLQVWATLSWFGWTAHRDFPDLQRLVAQAEGFGREDRDRMLVIQEQILTQIFAPYETLAHRGQLATTPYFHPILPLLVDTAHAQRNLPGVEDVGFAYPEDAAAQLALARERLAALFGAAPDGLWPSEGSVSPEVIALAEAEGFGWFVTDEAVLEKSKSVATGVGAGAWRVGGMRGFFRDRDLSDRIGFRYGPISAHEAVTDFVSALDRRTGTAVVALDGENPWETFTDAGGAFLQGLVDACRSKIVRFEDVATVGEVTDLWTGSWINADFGIWYGHAQDRAAWRHLAVARAAAARSPDPSPAMPHLYAAEGSDWTWWYGEDFSTPFAWAFDALFRAHLRAAWLALRLEPPAALDVPLTEDQTPLHQPPVCTVSPGLSGASFGRWMGAGTVRWPKGSTMARGLLHTPGLRYGWDETFLWLLVQFTETGREEASWVVQVDDCQLSSGASDCGEAEERACLFRSPRGLIVRVPLATLDERVSIIVVAGGMRYPEHGGVSIRVPRTEPHLHHWSV